MVIVRLEVGHDKPYFPARDNAVKYIQETISHTVRNIKEVDVIETSLSKDKMSMTFTMRIEGNESVVKNKIGKVGKNIAKKYKTNFSLQ
jgi:hypothetical protein